MNCGMVGCKNQVKYKTVTSTPYMTQKPNYWCEDCAKDWMKQGLTVKGKIAGVDFTTTVEVIK